MFVYEIIIIVSCIGSPILEIMDLLHGFHSTFSMDVTIPKLRVYFFAIRLVTVLKAEMIWGRVKQ
jgi:Ca2+/Na+ antiporter